MSATGIAIVMELLTLGTLVNKVIVYGIVVQVKDLGSTKLIRLEIYFEAGQCKFVTCRKDFEFDKCSNVCPVMCNI